MAKTKEEWLEYFSNIHRKTDLKVVDRFVQQSGIDLKHREVFPTFFTGDITRKKSIVTVSLNPGYADLTQRRANKSIRRRSTKMEQGLENHDRSIQEIEYDAWFEMCRNRFAEYLPSELVHLVFTNLYKMLAVNPSQHRDARLNWLQSNLVNIDWCPYYSKNFSYKVMNSSEAVLLSEIWNDILYEMVTHIEPKLIFIHGAAPMSEWVKDNVEITHQVLTDIPAYSRCAHLKQGVFKNTNIPVLYLTSFANNVNSNTSTGLINREVQRIFNP